MTALLISMLASTTAHINAQTSAGTVQLIPSVSNVDADAGAFSVFVVLEDFHHLGVITYDDDRDTVPDREVPSPGLAAFEIIVDFDETVVAVDRVEPGPVFEGAARVFQCLPPQEEPGAIRFGCLSTGSAGGLQGSFTLASIQLQPLRPGSSRLSLEAGIAGPLGDGVSVDVSGGLIRVVAPPGKKTTPTPAGGPQPTSDSGGSDGTAPPSATAPAATPPMEASSSPTSLATVDGATATMETTTPIDGNTPPGDASDGTGSSSRTGLWIAVALGVGVGVVASVLAVRFMLLRRRANI